MVDAASFRPARVRWGQLEGLLDVEMSGPFLRLYRAYGGRSRTYHDRRHVVDVVDGVDRSSRRLRVDVRAALLAAAWFHDVVYDARRHDNEERSADVLARELRRHGIDRRVIADAVSLVLETKRHSPSTLDIAAKVLVDADLATLSASPERYDAYSAAIREEYAWVPDAAYQAGRASVLRRFLERRSIYQARAMRRREPAARANIEREIKRLERNSEFNMDEGDKQDDSRS